jgi:hypothetical protein
MTKDELLDLMPSQPRKPLLEKLKYKMRQLAMNDEHYMEYLVDAQDTDRWEVQSICTYFKDNGFDVDIIPPATCLDYYTIMINW